MLGRHGAARIAEAGIALFAALARDQGRAAHALIAFLNLEQCVTARLANAATGHVVRSRAFLTSVVLS